jgi:hypothetical protein
MFSRFELGQSLFVAVSASLRRGNFGFGHILVGLMISAMTDRAIYAVFAVFAEFPIRHNSRRHFSRGENARALVTFNAFLRERTGSEKKNESSHSHRSEYHSFSLFIVDFKLYFML